MDMAVEEPKWGGAFELLHVLASRVFRANTRGVKPGDANDPETEIWRGCQRSSTAMVWGYDCFLLLGDVEAHTVYLANQANDILTNAFTLSRAEPWV
jgi:hypothetical protein